MSNLKTQLLLGEERIMIFGAGYIGYSTAAFYAKKGIRSLLIDIDEGKVKKINQGKPPYPELQAWLGFDVAPLKGIIEATTHWEKAISDIYFIAVNTEKNAEPFSDALEDVCEKIDKVTWKTPLVIIESTLVPGWVDKIMRPHLPDRIAVAPRRDWFTLPGMTVETLDRVIGATDPETLAEAMEILSLVSPKLHPASDYRIVEFVKAIENAYRQVGIAISYELATAFPDLNIREGLRLAATKWNMDLYQPSLGIGGYCLPLAPKYLQSATSTELSIFKEAIKVDELMPFKIASSMVNRGVKKAVVLGIAYKGDLKVHIASSGIRTTEALEAEGIEAAIHDPLYTSKEIYKLTNVYPAIFPRDLSLYDAVIISCDHVQYKTIDRKTLVNNLRNCKYILDAFGVWEKYREVFKEKEIDYKIIGEPNWL